MPDLTAKLEKLCEVIKGRAILSRCDACGKPLLFAQLSYRGTAYCDDSRNYGRWHRKCYRQEREYWDEMWRDYYSGCL